MAQANFTPIQLYYSSTASAAPSPGNLANGELAINIRDGKLYYKDDSGNVQTLATKTATTNSISFGTTGLTPSSATQGAVTVSGTLSTANGGTGQTSYTDGQLLIGNTTGNTLSKANLTAGSGISITNGSGAITIAATNFGTVTSVTATSPVVSSGGSTPVISLNTVPVSSGGTGLTSYTSGGVLYASGTGTLATSTGLTFSSNSLGIGKSIASYRLDVERTIDLANSYIASFVTTSTNTSQATLLRISQGSSAYEGLIGTFGSAYSVGGWAATFGVGSFNNIPLSLGTNNTVRVYIDTSGNAQMQTGVVMPYSPAPASISTTATLTAANIQSQIINTTGTSYTITMPLGTTLETVATWSGNNIAYDFTVINTASGTITVAANTGVTTLGSLTIATGTSAQFRIRRTALNSYVLYRLN